MKFSTILKGAAAAAVVGGLAVTTAGAASASTTARHAKPVEAITSIVNRADNGGGGNQWAYDSFTRDLKVSYLGKSADPAMAATPYMYYATITDTGTFRDMPGQLAPNQGSHNVGKVLRPGQVTGPMTGSGQWGVFYASARAHNGLAPTVLRGVKLNALYPSSTWPELAFPQGTTFSGLSESSYDYNYQAVPFTKYVVKTVNGKRVIVKVTGFRQHWEDAWFNGDGQLPHDGNILGVH
jgi:hypothetical protein